MKFASLRLFIAIWLFCPIRAQTQLAVTVSPPLITGQKAVVALAMTNGLPEKIESARAVCFLLDEQGQMIGQASKWVIVSKASQPALEPKTGATYNFVITSRQPFATTNLTAKVSFSRIVLQGGKAGNPAKDIIVSSSTQ